MDLGLAGRVALVTGASKGIGFGIASALVTEDARVAVASRDAGRIEAAAARIGALPIVFDSQELDAVDGVVDAVERQLGPIDVYVANTGGPPTGDDPLAFSRAEWEAAYRSLVLSPMAFISRLLPAMRERGWGRIVDVSSVTVRQPLPHNQLSNAHRPGLVSAFKVLARQSAADGITLNHVLPGRIGTDRLFGNAGSAGRVGAVEEVAAAAVFLCSAPASYITGTTLLVDGGLTASV